ncbi:MAG TPA: serine/threonine-protein kinase [Candidatus Limnocylindrales bacterium]|jgi:serine/threonine-protein kinase|nr:serine/threonine-protein kinase [Candidatus Limnocylindrales bacterium]
MPASGDLLADRYRILAPLGAGGMATVYRAHDERLGREVAVKILLPNLAANPVLATRFEREARTLAAAAHPGVVSIFDVDAGDPSTGREPFFVMELCPGGSLADRLVDGQRVTPDELIPTLVSIADGLADLHARGVVHRDVKPSNILFAADRAKLADFGLARADADELDDLTSPGTAVGTIAYLAPEVLAGETAGSAADIYALGVAGFVGLTGTVPRSATSLTELAATAGEAAPTASAAAPYLGQAFDEPIAAALDPDPGRRPDALGFASSMTAALGSWGRSRPSIVATAAPMSEADVATDATTAIAVPTMPAQSAEPSPEGKDERSRRSFGLAAGTLLAVVAAIAVLALLGSLLRTGSSPPASPPLASVVPSPSPSATPSPSASAPAVPSVTDRALAALDAVDAAISATAGKDGLKGKERNDLERLAGEVRSALVGGDLDAARTAAEALGDQIDKVSDKLDEQRARRLEDAASALSDILGAGE